MRMSLSYRSQNITKLLRSLVQVANGYYAPPAYSLSRAKQWTKSCNSGSNVSPITILQLRHTHSQSIEDFLDLKIDQRDTETYVEASPVSTGREGLVVETHGTSGCSLCRLNLKNLAYTDVMILSQFIKRDGTMATFHESRLCTKQYRKVIKLIKQAQRCNLMSRPADYLVPGPWHDLNTYLERDRRRDQPMKVIKKEYWKL